MIRRLSISLLLMGLAVFALGAAAFAFFSTSQDASVSIVAGTPALSFEVDQDCDDDIDASSPPFDFLWEGIVPGDTTSDCIFITNDGDGELIVYAKHSAFSNPDGPALRDATRWRYNAIGTGGVNCDFSRPQNSQYTNGRGCLLDTIDEGETFELQVDVQFVDSGDQNNLIGDMFGFTSTITGYTS